MKPQPTEKHKACLKCNGTGESRHESFTAMDGTYYPERIDPCLYCKGEGWYAPIDVKAICEDIKGRKGLRSKRPESPRAYYVWRLARFHGGVDVTMPVCAELDNAGDPFIDLLDLMADKVAVKVFGTDKAAAYRWINALGHSLPVPDSIPATAFSCGPVVTEEKPDCEIMELH